MSISKSLAFHGWGELVPEGREVSLDLVPTFAFLANWGPLDRPILARDYSPALGVLAEPDRLMPIGTAFPVGLVSHPRGPAVTFRLVIGKQELPDRYLCDCRRFVRLGESVEEL